MKFTIKNPLTKLAAGISAYLMSANAYADTLATLSTNVATQVYEVSDVISTASYVAGAAFGMAGVMKLKAHAENPGQTPLMHGVGRIATGAALVALPWVINTAFNTGGSNETQGTGISGYMQRF